MDYTGLFVVLFFLGLFGLGMQVVTEIYTDWLYRRGLK